ncbi:MAG TPA: DUF481 domain-containing protein, partial [Phnomibacter sp.]|nr:DUF481 domain-containing protein [Phnomibacter sp.]
LKSKNKKNLLLLTGNYDLAKAQQANLVNSSFAHLRFNHKVNNWLRWEAFTQTQTNTPLGIQFRWLTGTGPRFKIQLSQHANIYLGSLYMYEVEHTLSQQEEKRNYDHRNSSYASVSITIPSLKADIVSTSYWQPLYRDISDYRLTTETRMDFRITRQFRLFARTNFFFDSQPPKGIRRRAINTEQGFGFNF